MTKDFYTVTEDGTPIFAALHNSVEHHPTADRCVSLSVGQSAASFSAEEARALGNMLLSASDTLEGRPQ